MMKKNILLVFLVFVVACSENNSNSGVNNDRTTSISKRCTYEQSYIDKHTREFIDITNAYISAHKANSSLPSIQGFYIFNEAYQKFLSKRHMIPEIVNNEVCKEQIGNLVMANERANDFIRKEKRRIFNEL